MEAVYLPLVNSLHREWTLRALAAGKHVLCEKPLALSAKEAEEMAGAAQKSQRLLMEALMYRFHPRLVRLREQVEDALFVHAAFGFPLRDAANPRLDPQLGGGALLDVGSYVISAARWFLGEPDRVAATAHLAAVDLSLAVSLGFPGGGQASLWASFESPEHQDLVVLTKDRALRVEGQAFTAWKDPDDPYQLMVEAFADACLSGGQAPIPIEDSICNLKTIDQVRRAAGISPGR